MCARIYTCIHMYTYSTLFRRTYQWFPGVPGSCVCSTKERQGWHGRRGGPRGIVLLSWSLLFNSGNKIYCWRLILLVSVPTGYCLIYSTVSVPMFFLFQGANSRHFSAAVQGYYDEEGWYYPPPGAEEYGEVPEMPPAEGETAAEGAEGAEGEAVASPGATSTDVFCFKVLEFLRCKWYGHRKGGTNCLYSPATVGFVKTMSSSSSTSYIDGLHQLARTPQNKWAGLKHGDKSFSFWYIILMFTIVSRLWDGFGIVRRRIPSRTSSCRGMVKLSIPFDLGWTIVNWYSTVCKIDMW